MSKDKEQRKDPDDSLDRRPHILGAVVSAAGGKEHVDLSIRIDPRDLGHLLDMLPLAPEANIDHAHEAHDRAHELDRQEREALAIQAKRKADAEAAAAAEEAAKQAASAPPAPAPSAELPKQ